jgi:hypothetical protein
METIIIKILSKLIMWPLACFYFFKIKIRDFRYKEPECIEQPEPVDEFKETVDEILKPKPGYKEGDKIRIDVLYGTSFQNPSHEIRCQAAARGSGGSAHGIAAMGAVMEYHKYRRGQETARIKQSRMAEAQKRACENELSVYNGLRCKEHREQQRIYNSALSSLVEAQSLIKKEK